MDQKTDGQQRHVSNVTIGSMNDLKSSKSYLLSCEFLDKVNAHTVVQNVLNALMKLWPNGIQYNRVLLIITDAEPYVKSAGKTLMNMFEKAHHITCLCHALHNLSQHIQTEYPDVNRFISCGKLAFHKSDMRKNLLTQNNLPMTPQPITTRWGTWIKATEYYANNFESFCSLINALDGKSCIYVEELKDLIGSKKTKIWNDSSYLSRLLLFG